MRLSGSAFACDIEIKCNRIISRIRKRKSLDPRIAAQIEAEKTYADFIAWSKTAFYWIITVLIILAFLTSELMEQEANTTVKSMHR